MLKVAICYSTKIIISYDSRLETPAVTMTLEKAIAIATTEMTTYGFLIADIIDANTGEVLAIIEDG